MKVYVIMFFSEKFHDLNCKLKTCTVVFLIIFSMAKDMFFLSMGESRCILLSKFLFISRYEVFSKLPILLHCITVMALRVFRPTEHKRKCKTDRYKSCKNKPLIQFQILNKF